VLHEAQRRRRLAVTGPYAYVRHPQYLGFIAIMFGFLLQWPTLLTLLMFPILVAMYVRLAHREEREVIAEFGEVYRRYTHLVPAFVPRPGAAGQFRPEQLHPRQDETTGHGNGTSEP
jgi:protein-S-isoprenylcysteine O-methyltransferase Ste14